MEKYTYKVACTKKELSCYISNLFCEIMPICECCNEDVIVIKGVINGAYDIAKITITEYGFEYEGDFKYLDKIRKAVCLCNL